MRASLPTTLCLNFSLLDGEQSLSLQDQRQLWAYMHRTKKNMAKINSRTKLQGRL